MSFESEIDVDIESAAETQARIESDNIAESLAAQLTGTEGMADEAIAYEADGGAPMPEDLVSETEAYDQLPDRARKVPLAALQEERTKRQQMQAQLQQREQQMAQMQQQFQQMQQQFQQQQLAAQQAQEAQIPSFAEDPEGHVAALREQFAQRLEQIQAGQQAQVQQQQAVVQEQQIRAELAEIGRTIAPQEAEFAARQPDYREAGEFLQQQVAAQLRAQYPQAAPQTLEFVQTLALGQLAKQCQTQGINAAEYLYQRAVARGWQGNVAAPAQRQAPAPTLPPKAPRTLATVESSVEQGAREFSLETIAHMSDAEFDQAWAQMAKGGKPKFGY